MSPARRPSAPSRHAATTVLAVLALLLGCRSAYYAAWDKLGKEKRHLLRDRVEDARDAQGEAGEQFQDALTRIQALYGFAGGDLEKVYGKLESDFERSEARADSVRGRVRQVEAVAADLFREWAREIELISSADLRRSSRAKLDETERRYRDLRAAMKKAEASMDPVLVRFRDQVLYLKHNLNAQAIGALQGEGARIESDVAGLLADMGAAIAEADAFLKTLPP